MNITTPSALRLPVPALGRRHRLFAALLLPLLAAGIFLLPASAQTATSAVPGFFNFQGKVVAANGTPLGASPTPVNRTVIFRIWDHSSNSATANLVYSEQQTVTITDGEFSVLIGQGSAVSGTPLGYSEAAKGPPTVKIGDAGVFAGATRYLGITVDDGNAGTTDPEITPRQQLVTSAYAFRAKYAESVGSNGANTIVALDNGYVGIGTANPAARLDVVGAVRAGGAANGSFVLANAASNSIGTVGAASTAGTFSTDAAANDVVMRAEAGKLLLQTGVGASAMVIDSANKVGVGTTAPGAKLEVVSSDTLNTAFISNTGGGGGTQPALRVKMAAASGARNVIQAENSSGSVFAVRDDGRVGIGSSSPSARLDVNGAIMVNSGIANNSTRPALGTARISGEINSYSVSTPSNDDGFLRLSAGGGTSAITKSFIDLSGYSTVADMNLNITFGTGGTERMRINSSGNVGIGTASPVARLHVAGAGSVTGNLSYYIDGFGHGGPWGSNPYTRSDISIYASNSMVCPSGFFVISDARTKNVIGVSNGKADLATLSKIQVTDYTFRDVPALGARVHKKVVAQQVEQIFPQAVSRFKDVVADIFKPATIVDGWIQLATDLRPGERVRLITEAGTKDVHEVLEVGADRFRTSSLPAGTKVFVYGREVDDFRIVDYEAISMLNVSATQELKRQNDSLRTANEALAARVTELEAKDRVRDAKFAAIERLLQANQTVMARPAAVSQSNANGQE